MRTAVTLVAKGPSAKNALAIVRDGDAIACVNDAGMLLPGEDIDYVFFSDANVFPLLEPMRDRFERAISRKMNQAQLESMPDWLVMRHSMYDDISCAGEHDELCQRVILGRIMHHHSTPGALHWLAKYGKYNTIRVVGVDGGTRYANNLSATGAAKYDLDEWATVTRRVGDICSRVYGTVIEWHS